MTIRPVPKPVRRDKAKRPLRSRKWGTRRRPARAAKTADLAFPRPVAPRKTKHGRRQRELGRMCFYAHLWCMLRDISLTGNVQSSIVEMTQDCGTGVWSAIEVAHLGTRGATGTGGWRRAPDWTTAPLCRKHHKAIDGKEGGRAPWYVALGRAGQAELREKLYAFAGYYWDNLTDDGRARWERQALEERAAG